MFAYCSLSSAPLLATQNEPIIMYYIPIELINIGESAGYDSLVSYSNVEINVMAKSYIKSHWLVNKHSWMVMTALKRVLFISDYLIMIRFERFDDYCFLVKYTVTKLRETSIFHEEVARWVN